MRWFGCFITTIVCTLGGNVHARQDLTWPLDIPPAVTSSFAEYRPDRLHAGIDLTTGGRTGVPVWAAGDGFLSRVRVSPYGYGKSLYLKLRDGRTVVYAHLSRFTDDLDRYVLEEQYSRKSYSLNLYPRPNQFSVSRGALVGYSGRTGIGNPHLHVEIRDREGRPTSPLHNGFLLDDRRPPRITHLAVIPLSASSRVNGRSRLAVIRLKQRDGVWTTDQIPRVWGPIALSAKPDERSHHANYRLGVYSRRLMLDGVPVFNSTYDRFEWPTQHHSNFDLDFTLMARGLGRFLVMSISSGNRLRFYGDKVTSAGVIHAGVAEAAHPVTPWPPGEHSAELTFGDFAGNTCTARISFLVSRPPRLLTASVADSDRGRTIAVNAEDDGDLIGVGVDQSLDGGKTWIELAGSRVASHHGAMELVGDVDSTWIYRAWASDAAKNRTSTLMRPISSELGSLPSLSLTPVIHGDAALINIGSDRALTSPPSVDAWWLVPYLREYPTTLVGPNTYQATVPIDDRLPRGQSLNILADATQGTVVADWLDTVHADIAVYPISAGNVDNGPTYEGILRVPDNFPGKLWLQARADGALAETTLVGALVHPDGGHIFSSDSLAEIMFKPRTVAERMFVSSTSTIGDSLPELSPVGLVYRFEPQEVPFDEWGKLSCEYRPACETAPRSVYLVCLGTKLSALM